MKGLETIPSENDFLKAYEDLQAHSDKISVSKLALWSQWARFDPRLAEQWISHIGNVWKIQSPAEWNEKLKELPWPAAAGPILEHACSFANCDREGQKLFRQWIRCAMSGIQPAAGEQYFIGLRAFGSHLMQKDVIESLKPYLNWGYFGREILVNKALAKKGRTWIPANIRLEILNRLLKTHLSIRTSDYIEMLGGGIGQRQAELDLQNHPKLKPMGNTKGRFYRRIK